MNTKICYMYRDASNYKMYNMAVLNGQLTDKQKSTIFSCLHDGEWFIPFAVGLDEERFSDFNPDEDHPWFELDEYSFEDTVANPTVNITPAQLVEAFKVCKPMWSKLEYEAMLRLTV